MQSYYSNGKLLLTGEYLVLHGAVALAVPVKYGQDLKVQPIDKSGVLFWESYDEKRRVWFQAELALPLLEIRRTSDSGIAETLVRILKTAVSLNPAFLNADTGIRVVTRLNFPRDWGLGTSSTLINNIAMWAKLNPYTLLDLSFGGSGYDIACAQHKLPLLYRKTQSGPQVELVDFNPVFKNRLFFVYLNKKQNSRISIKKFLKNKQDLSTVIPEIEKITAAILKSEDLSDFESLVAKHESLIGKVLGIEPVKERLFPDYFGAVKSLGAWGGDFVLATGNKKTPDYFKSKGYQTLIPYKEMVLA